MSFSFDPSLEMFSNVDKIEYTQHPGYMQLGSDPNISARKPEPYQCKPNLENLESEKRKESGRLAAKKYRERVKEGQILLKEDLQKLREDNVRLKEENDTLKKVLHFHTEKIVRSIDGISMFIRVIAHSRNDTYNGLNQIAAIDGTHTNNCLDQPDSNYYGDNCNYDTGFGTPIHLALNDCTLPMTNDLPYTHVTHNSGSSMATEPCTGPGSFHTTSDSHSTYNVFVFILVLLLPVKLFPYIIFGYLSNKNASRTVEVFNAISLQASLRIPTSFDHKQPIPSYSSYSSIDNYSVLERHINNTYRGTHQSALIPMMDAQIQVTSESSDSLFQLWKQSSLSTASHNTSLSSNIINKTDLCQYYNSQDPAARNSMVEVIESELKRTCSANPDNKQLDKLDSFIVDVPDNS